MKLVYMAMRRIFWSFCRNRFLMSPLHYISSRIEESSTPRLGESESRFQITNISANSEPNSERLERQCKGLIRNRFLQKPQVKGTLWIAFVKAKEQNKIINQHSKINDCFEPLPFKRKHFLPVSSNPKYHKYFFDEKVLHIYVEFHTI